MKTFDFTKQLKTSTPDAEFYSKLDKTRLSTERTRNLTLKYNDALIEHGIIMSKKELKSKNIIDVRKLLPINLPPDDPFYALSLPIIPNDTHNRLDFIDKVGWLSCMPCFREGVIRVNTKRYIYFHVNDFDTEDKTFTVYLNDYTYLSGELTTSIFGEATYIFTDSKRYSNIVTHPDTTYLCSKIYSILSQNDLQWSDDDYKYWVEQQITYSKSVEDECESKNENQFQTLANTFCLIMTHINNQLYLHKPSRPVKKSSSNDTSNKTIVAMSKTKEKVIRNIGILSVKSVHAPKMPTEQSIIHYKTESWSSRAHIRTYKSGKQVFVKGSIHHRKALANDKETNHKIPQQIIKFVDKGEK